MADDGRDMLLMLKWPGSPKPLPGECTAVLGKDDDMTKGFERGYFSDLQDFEIVVGLADDGGSIPDSPGGAVVPKKLPKGMMYNPATKQIMDMKTGKVIPQGSASPSSSSSFSRFMDKGHNGIAGQRYLADLQPITFTKMFDSASMWLFKACSNQKTLPAGVLVKRKAVGKMELRGYLRIDFTDILITDIDWEEDRVIKEKVTFITRKVQIKYQPESDSGDLDPSLPPASWSLRDPDQ